MAAIVEIARARGIAVLADAAQAVGARHASRGVGAWGDAVCLSFYPTKNVGACGDGGMLLTSRDDLAERARRLRDHGSVRRYEHVELGLSSRLDELQAAFLRVKLVRLPEWNRRRGHIAARYRSLLGGLPVGLPVERRPDGHVYHQFTIRAPRRDSLAAALGDLGIGTTVHYPMTIPAQPLFGTRGRRRGVPPGDARGARGALAALLPGADRRRGRTRWRRASARLSLASPREDRPRDPSLASPAAMGKEPLRLRRADLLAEPALAARLAGRRRLPDLLRPLRRHLPAERRGRRGQGPPAPGEAPAARGLRRAAARDRTRRRRRSSSPEASSSPSSSPGGSAASPPPTRCCSPRTRRGSSASSSWTC